MKKNEEISRARGEGRGKGGGTGGSARTEQREENDGEAIGVLQPSALQGRVPQIDGLLDVVGNKADKARLVHRRVARHFRNCRGHRRCSNISSCLQVRSLSRTPIRKRQYETARLVVQVMQHVKVAAANRQGVVQQLLVSTQTKPAAATRATKRHARLQQSVSDDSAGQGDAHN